MEQYLQAFHGTKDMFLEFRTSKATQAKAGFQDWEFQERITDLLIMVNSTEFRAKQ